MSYPSDPAPRPPAHQPCARCAQLFAGALEAVLVALEAREGPVIAPLVDRLRAMQEARAAMGELNAHLNVASGTEQTIT